MAERTWRRAQIAFIAKVLITVAFTWYVLTAADVARIPAALDNLQPGWLLLAFLAVGAHSLASFVRWQEIVASLGERISLANVARIYFGVMFVSNVLPSPVLGDAIRAWKAKNAGVSLKTAAHSVLFDRALTILGLFFIVGSAGWFLPANGDWWLPGAAVVALLATIAIIGATPILRRHPYFSESKGVPGTIFSLFDSASMIASSRRRWTIAMMTIMAHLFSGATFYFILRGIGVALSPCEVVLYAMPVLLVSGLPISIAGWGVREAGAVQAFAVLGVAPESAMLASVAFGLLSVVVSLPGAIVVFGTPMTRRHRSARPGVDG
jgi:uncharacterized membrane protein YbhN (UPF0104 family)